MLWSVLSLARARAHFLFLSLSPRSRSRRRWCGLCLCLNAFCVSVVCLCLCLCLGIYGFEFIFSFFLFVFVCVVIFFVLQLGSSHFSACQHFFLCVCLFFCLSASVSVWLSRLCCYLSVQVFLVNYLAKYPQTATHVLILLCMCPHAAILFVCIATRKLPFFCFFFFCFSPVIVLILVHTRILVLRDFEAQVFLFSRLRLFCLGGVSLCFATMRPPQQASPLFSFSLLLCCQGRANGL
jgi:hypothetical protein